MAIWNNKKPSSSTADFLDTILDAHDTDIVIVRGSTCDVLYANKSARLRMSDTQSSNDLGILSDPLFFDEVFHHYSLNQFDITSDFASIDVNGAHGQVFSVRYSPVTWTDNKPAVAIFIRNVTKDRADQKKLYDLAYTDLLTSVSNRLKFKEDFEKISKDIEAGLTSGIVAIFDLDNFKTVNDTYGHNTGDVMLRRITSHLDGQPAFQNHLYRLGGDEFVLFYHHPVNEHGDEEATKQYYTQLLQGTLLSYTMPNIETTCTLSMGVAFFPQHGSTWSELLRKSDIALYKAKGNGRNQFMFFEDRYDSAKKFKDLYINIQPILTKQGRNFGYELVECSSNDDEEDSLNLSNFNRTLEALDVNQLSGDMRYFIVCTQQLLIPSVMNNLPKDKFVIQIKLPSNAFDVNKELLADLHKSGYHLALLDVCPENATDEVLKFASYVKFHPNTSADFQKQLIQHNKSVFFIATDVNSATQFDHYNNLGFKFFQGYHFSTPSVVKKTKSIDPLKMNYLRLLQLTSTENYADFSEISTIISSDVALSYKLLRLLNSAALGLRNPVSSVDMALSHLGEENLKQWVGMLALRGVAQDKPLELVRMSLVRARFGELLSPHFKPPHKSKLVFFTGLLSLLHIALEKPCDDIFRELPVADSIRLSITTSTGPYSDLLEFYTNYEYGNWEEVGQFVRKNGLSDRLVNDTYLSATKWYDLLLEELDD